MKFNYEVVDGAINTINQALISIEEAIGTPIVNNTYISGNAKETVDNYIKALNSCFDPIKPEVKALHDKLAEIREAYFAAESKVNAGLGTSEGATDSAATASKGPSSSVSYTRM